MVELLIRLIINAALLLIVARLVPGLYVEGWGSAFIGAGEERLSNPGNRGFAHPVIKPACWSIM
jgi:hypothetical protein